MPRVNLPLLVLLMPLSWQLMIRMRMNRNLIEEKFGLL